MSACLLSLSVISLVLPVSICLRTFYIILAQQLLTGHIDGVPRIFQRR